MIKSTSSLLSLEPFSWSMTATMSFSRASKAAVPRPVKRNFFEIPRSVWFLVAFPFTLVGKAVAGAGAGPLPGTGPGGPRSGSEVRGGMAEFEGEGLAAFAIWGAEKSSDRPSTKANCFLSASRARSKPCSRC